MAKLLQKKIILLDKFIIQRYNKIYKRILYRVSIGKRRCYCLSNILKKLGEAELEIMQVIWNNGNPVTSNYILKELQGRRKWKLSTLMTSLARLVDKGFINCDRSMGCNLYTAIIMEKEYKTGASKHFLEKLYNNSIQNMVATLYSNKTIKKSDVEELRKFLDEIEKDYSEDETL